MATRAPKAPTKQSTAVRKGSSYTPKSYIPKEKEYVSSIEKSRRALKQSFSKYDRMADQFHAKYLKTLRSDDSFMKKFMLTMTHRFLNNTFVKIAMKAFDNVKMYTMNLFREVMGPLNEYFDLIMGVVSQLKELGKAAMSWVGNMAKGLWGKITGKKPGKPGEEESGVGTAGAFGMDKSMTGLAAAFDTSTKLQTSALTKSMSDVGMLLAYKDEETQKAFMDGIISGMQEEANKIINSSEEIEKDRFKREARKQKPKEKGDFWAMLLGALLAIAIGVLKWFKQIWSVAKFLFTKVWSWIKWIWSGFKWFFGKVWDLVKWLWKGVKVIFEKAWNWIRKVFGGVWDEIAERASKVWKWIKGIVGGVWDDIAAKAGGVWKWIKGIFGGIWDEIIGWAGKVKGIFKGPTFEAIFGFFGKIGSAIKSAFSGAAGKIVEWVVEIWGKISKFFGAVGKGGGWISKILGYVPFFAKLIKWIPIIGWVITGIMGVFDFFKGFDAGKAESIFGGSGLFAKIMSGVSYLVSGLTMGLVSPETIGKILKTITEVVIGIADKITWLGEQLYGAGKWIYEKLSEAAGWFVGIIPKIWEGFKTVIDYTYGLPLKILNLIFPGVEKAVKDFFYKMGDGVIDVLKGLWDWIKDKAKSIPVIGSLFGGENKPGEKSVWEKAKEMSSAAVGAITTTQSEAGKALIGQTAAGVWGPKGEKITPTEAGGGPRTAGAPVIRTAEGELVKVESATGKAVTTTPTMGTEAKKATSVNIASSPPVVIGSPPPMVQEAPSMLTPAANALILQNYY
jgi:hypothetical protein